MNMETLQSDFKKWFHRHIAFYLFKNWSACIKTKIVRFNSWKKKESYDHEGQFCTLSIGLYGIPRLITVDGASNVQGPPARILCAFSVKIVFTCLYDYIFCLQNGFFMKTWCQNEFGKVFWSRSDNLHICSLTKFQVLIFNKFLSLSKYIH